MSNSALNPTVEECSKVVKAVIDGGAFDAIRKKVIEELKSSETLKAYVQEKVDASKTLGAENKNSKDRKKVLEDLNKELTEPLVEKASRTVWELLSAPDSPVAKEVELKVHEVLCKMYEEKQAQAAAAGPGPSGQQRAGQSSTEPGRPGASRPAQQPTGGGGASTAQAPQPRLGTQYGVQQPPYTGR